MPPEVEEVETWRCTVCGREYDESSEEPVGALHDGRLYCYSCESSVATCYHCNEAYEMGMGGYCRIETAPDDPVVCDSCRDVERYIDCGHCGYTVHPSNTQETADGSVCDTCFDDEYEQCHDCQAFVTDTFSFDEGDWCRDCARNRIEQIMINAVDCSQGRGCECHTELLDDVMQHAFYCNAFSLTSRRYNCVRCGERRIGLVGGDSYTMAYVVVTDSYSDAVCPSCHNGGGPTTYRILNYTYKPTPLFKRTDRDLGDRSLHFGTEVEVDVAEGSHRDEALRLLCEGDKERLFYCKHDVSCGAGFEIVSHPFTCDWMQNNDSAFRPMFGLASTMRGYESVRCGMHIHMSKDAFSEMQMFKFMRFFHLNKHFIRALARRPTGRFDRWARMNVPERSSLMRFVLNKERIDFGRGALNMEPENTMECRIFRSSLSPTAYYGSVEFLQGLFDYTKNCGVDDEQLSKPKFMEYIHSRGRAYKNFVLLTDTIRPEVEDNWEVECA